MMLSGTTPTQWTAKHVIAHHVETNVVPVDDDTMYPMKRVLVALPRLAYHRYQHIYMWLMYLVTLPLWTASNAVKVLACSAASSSRRCYPHRSMPSVDAHVALDQLSLRGRDACRLHLAARYHRALCRSRHPCCCTMISLSLAHLLTCSLVTSNTVALLRAALRIVPVLIRTGARTANCHHRKPVVRAPVRRQPRGRGVGRRCHLARRHHRLGPPPGHHVAQLLDPLSALSPDVGRPQPSGTSPIPRER